MKNSILVKILLVTATLPLLAGCIVYRDRPAPPPVAVQEVPPPQAEVIPVQPDPSFVWIGGYYNYGPGGYVWFPGRWSPRPRPGAVWVSPHWGYHGHRRVWVGGGWR